MTSSQTPELPAAQGPAGATQSAPASAGGGLKKGRDPQLDLLRAAAILSVVISHLFQMSPEPMPGLMRFARVGQHGVDLFFVLSGWLIGTLYWKEAARFGNVQLLRFWGRRWIRTIPPYLVALALAWAAVYVERRQPFDFAYLAFVQNYYHRLPFFLVSWSLCIEEHFYLFVPMLLLLIGRSGKRVMLLFGCLILAAPVCRCVLAVDGIGSEFGFVRTATHLRMEGLLLGFLAAWLPAFNPTLWKRLQSISGWALAVGTIVMGVICCLPHIWLYRVGLTVLAVTLISLLIFLVARPPGFLADTNAIYWIALTSYSVYLTHALMLHAARKAVALWHLPQAVYFPVALVLIAVAGLLFYFAFEWTAIRMRDSWMPRRTAKAA